jgi:hypothetical protein
MWIRELNMSSTSENYVVIPGRGRFITLFSSNQKTYNAKSAYRMGAGKNFHGSQWTEAES